jgi:5-methylcytosine-specific restriction protein A
VTVDPLEQLRPAGKPRVMDLVEQAGIDVSPWRFKANGAPVATPAANPAYCYEWCFEDAQRVVFSIWFDHLRLEGGRVLVRANMRDLRRRIEKAKHLDAGTRTANVRRAQAVDTAVQHAFRRKLPARVIICEGDRRKLDDLASRDPSRVERRLLDPSPWRVMEYNDVGFDAAGDALIVRDLPLE